MLPKNSGTVKYKYPLDFTFFNQVVKSFVVVMVNYPYFPVVIQQVHPIEMVASFCRYIGGKYTNMEYEST